MRGMRVFLVFLAISGAAAAQAADSWGRRAAGLTVAEYLDGWYKFEFGVHFTHDGVRESNRVGFHPTADPNTATVAVLQLWRDNLVSDLQLRRDIRAYGAALAAGLQSSLKRPEIAGRWRPAGTEPNLLIRHVSYDDPSRTLAVTLGRETLFEAEEIRRGENLARSRGVSWE